MQRCRAPASSRFGKPASQRQIRLADGTPRAQRRHSRWSGLLEDSNVAVAEEDWAAGARQDPVEAARQSVEAAFSQPVFTYNAVRDRGYEEDAVERLRLKLQAVNRELHSVTESEYAAGLAARPSSPRLHQPASSINNVVLHPHVLHRHLPLADEHQQQREQHQQPREQQQQQHHQQREAEPAPVTPRLEGTAGGRAEGTGREVLLQGFNWESWKGDWFQHIAGQAQEIADMGFTTVWLPPFTDSVSEQGYMPRDLYDLNSRYGSEEQLINCVKSLQSHGIKVLGDAVLNHRCAHYQGKGGIWNQFGGKMAWDERAIVGDHQEYGGRGNLSSGEFFGAAPNIDHSQPFVKRDLSEWMVWLRTHVGFDGWRLDFVKGFHGSHVKDYLEASKPEFVVGEYWDSLAYQLDGTPCHNQDAHRQRIVNWIEAAGGLATAFDITTKGILHAVFERCEYWRLQDASGKPPGLMGWWPSRAVTFLENHDTGSTQGHWRFPHFALEQGHVYILTHPGTPTVFYDHIYDNTRLRDVITRLIDLRKRNGINCRSAVKILRAERDVYVAEIDGKLLVKLGPGDFVPEDIPAEAGKPKPQYATADCGHCWTIWEKK